MHLASLSLSFFGRLILWFGENPSVCVLVLLLCTVTESELEEGRRVWALIAGSESTTCWISSCSDPLPPLPLAAGPSRPRPRPAPPPTTPTPLSRNPKQRAEDPILVVPMMRTTPLGSRGSATSEGTSSFARSTTITFKTTSTSVDWAAKCRITIMPLIWFWMLIHPTVCHANTCLVCLEWCKLSLP